MWRGGKGGAFVASLFAQSCGLPTISLAGTSCLPALHNIASIRLMSMLPPPPRGPRSLLPGAAAASVASSCPWWETALSVAGGDASGMQDAAEGGAVRQPPSLAIGDGANPQAGARQEGEGPRQRPPSETPPTARLTTTPAGTLSAETSPGDGVGGIALAGGEGDAARVRRLDMLGGRSAAHPPL